MKPRAFVSFHLDRDGPEHARFISEIDNCGTPFSVEDSSNARSLEFDWEKLARDKIGRSHFMIVLVGSDMDSSKLVNEEIRLAKSRNVPFFGVYVGDANESSVLPIGLARNRTIPCDWKRVAAAIEQLLAEGKNHIFV